MKYAHVIAHKNGVAKTVQLVNVKWDHPDRGTYKLNIDGTVTTKIGLGGIGWVFRDHEGRWELGYSQSIPQAPHRTRTKGTFEGPSNSHKSQPVLAGDQHRPKGSHTNAKRR